MTTREQQVKRARRLASFAAVFGGWSVAACVTMYAAGRPWWASLEWVLAVANAGLWWVNTRIIKRLGGFR